MKRSYYYAAMDHCVVAIVNMINVKRKAAKSYREDNNYKDSKTGETLHWAEESAIVNDSIADELEKILHDKFGV